MTDSEKTTFMKFVEKKMLETPCRICPFNLMMCEETGCVFGKMREIVEQEEVDAHTVDAVEVVRCKDCKYFLPMDRFHQDYHPGRGECELNCWVRDSDWFCADGVRKGLCK